ncbi:MULTISPECIES: LytR/AlgR family response regulator transcription factor [Chryseobacterium]|uniref:DNA-binding LytR/AlgR family response regulator n=1 Tax=Chryseobacterium camelliae TaxID=1265445 RepID=A0ABU0TLM5_9FLAO|nr:MULTISPECIES: LytTR family DNA-binding domain-containing protein [Chryseobacterium]MDT3408968.1 DNA-binding LytR/AlgR family response regulator [Pseudacidovorax intermedius]MDQ1097175.1 DNA-binding LytR/AlgR family response regulator [Chryseobacterium camelliae]MDQ1101112.1 DNA-binding LytR/AlgR family response regulator [Chryseobacterium sp. SORGH_AS_1048]MDR6084555.1 DNA-binding LytR/AlgR family response regulator [Chryseobacterium sp. SORGH_AS_0909]MDR6132824.1 DNA-binding LytR/AlgR fami
MITCIIVDDEPLAIELLENHIRKIEKLQLVGKARNAIEAHAILQQQDVDLIFLDIQMPHLSGIDLMKSLAVKPKVIFTTAFREFAVEGFELEAVDYILKPITFERFFRAVDKVARNTVIEKPESAIMIRADGINRKIRTDDIIFIESQGNDVKLCLNHTVYLTKYTITDLTERLSENGFIRIHRSFLFNPKYVTGYTNSEIVMGNCTIPVGRNYREKFNAFVTTYSKAK